MTLYSIKPSTLYSIKPATLYSKRLKMTDMTPNPTKEEIDALERELCEQSHRIVFGDKRAVRTAVNPERQYAG